MNPEIQDYAKALQDHMDALKAEMRSKLDVRRTYYVLMRAKEALHIKERELIENTEK